jgi:hypothetical protein
MDDGDRSYLSYFVMVLGVLVFVMLYVWQNIEVTKLKLEYKKLLKSQEELVRENGRVLFNIERYRQMEYLDRSASALGMKPVTPRDFETIDMK